MGYSEGADKYPDKFLTKICRALVEAGEYDDMDTCKKQGDDEASTQASNWKDVAPTAMADYLGRPS